MIADYTDAANRQHRYEAGRAQEIEHRDLSEAAVPYCLYKLANAAGEDEAADAAWSRFMDLTDPDERDQIEAQLESDYRTFRAWSGCLADEADRITRDTAKLAAAKAIAAFGAWVAS